MLAAGRALRLRVADVVDVHGPGTDGAARSSAGPAQRALGVEGRIKQILISNGAATPRRRRWTDAVTRRIAPVPRAVGLEIQPVKRDGLRAADDAGNVFMQMFTTFGTFSIAAGILLIFLIFVMLAGERRSEMGVARAIGTRRGHLVETFLFEGARVRHRRGRGRRGARHRGLATGWSPLSGALVPGRDDRTPASTSRSIVAPT